MAAGMERDNQVCFATAFVVAGSESSLRDAAPSSLTSIAWGATTHCTRLRVSHLLFLLHENQETSTVLNPWVRCQDFRQGNSPRRG